MFSHQWTPVHVCSGIISARVHQLLYILLYSSMIKNRIKRDCFLKTLNQTTNLAYSLDRYLWVASALAAEKLQI